MRVAERGRGLLRAPLLAWKTLAQGRYDLIYDEMPIRLRRMSPAKSWNLARSGLNLQHRRLRPWGMPLHMQFERAMEVGLLEQLLAEVGPTLLTASMWAWGESLLHPRLPEALALVGKYPVVSRLSTNGQNLDDERIVQALAQTRLLV